MKLTCTINATCIINARNLYRNMPVPTTTSRIALDYASYLSLESKNRERSRLKELKPFSEIPGMINVSLHTTAQAQTSSESVSHTPRRILSTG